MLEDYGYNVLAAATIERALELALQHIGKIDLLLTDIVMPEMNGKDLAERITASDPEMEVLYMSGYTDNIIAEQNILRCLDIYRGKYIFDARAQNALDPVFGCLDHGGRLLQWCTGRQLHLHL